MSCIGAGEAGWLRGARVGGGEATQRTQLGAGRGFRAGSGLGELMGKEHSSRSFSKRNPTS